MAIVTPAQVRLYLGLGTDQDEPLLLELCASAEAFVLSYLGITSLDVANYEERHSGGGGRALVLDQFPVTAVASVTIDGIAVPAAVGQASGYLHDRSAVYLHGWRFTKGMMNVLVAYTAGFAVLPLDINRAAVELVAMSYQRRNRFGVSSKSIGQESISYAANDLTPSAKIALSRYMKKYFTTR